MRKKGLRRLMEERDSASLSRPCRAYWVFVIVTRGGAVRRCRGALPRADLFGARWAGGSRSRLGGLGACDGCFGVAAL